MKPLAERAMAIVDYCKAHPDMRAAGCVSLILNRSDERVEELKGALRGVAIMLNTELKQYEDEPWARQVRSALAGKVVG